MGPDNAYEDLLEIQQRIEEALKDAKKLLRNVDFVVAEKARLTWVKQIECAIGDAGSMSHVPGTLTMGDTLASLEPCEDDEEQDE